MIAQVLDERRHPVAPRRPRDRPLPLLDDRLDGLGERPADVPARAAAGARDRPQRQPRQHPRAARPARAAAAAACRPSTDTELLTALLADEPAADTVDALRPGPAARPRRVQPRRPRRAPGHRRPRPVRVPAARPRAGCRARCAAASGATAACGATTARATAGPVVGDGRARHRRRRVRPRRRAGRDRHPRGRARAPVRPLRGRDARRCACSS